MDWAKIHKSKSWGIGRAKEVGFCLFVLFCFNKEFSWGYLVLNHKMLSLLELSENWFISGFRTEKICGRLAWFCFKVGNLKCESGSAPAADAVTQAVLRAAPFVGFKSEPFCLMAESLFMEENMHFLFIWTDWDLRMAGSLIYFNFRKSKSWFIARLESKEFYVFETS